MFLFLPAEVHHGHRRLVALQCQVPDLGSSFMSKDEIPDSPSFADPG